LITTITYFIINIISCGDSELPKSAFYGACPLVLRRTARRGENAEDARQAVDQLQIFLQGVAQNVGQAPLENKKGLTLTQLTLCNCYGAEGGTRTRTGVRPLDPEYSAKVTQSNIK